MHPIIYVVVIVTVMMLFGALMRAAVSAANPAYRLSAVAQALGMQVTEGDHEYNLVVGAKPNLLLSLFGVTKYDVKLTASGAAGPHSLVLNIAESVFRVRLRRLTLRDQHSYLAQLTMSNVASVPFEAWRPGEYDGPQSRCGYPVLFEAQSPMGTWYIASPHPHAAQQLAPMLERLAQQAPHFHVVGGGGSLAIPLTRLGMASSCPQLPMLRQELVAIGQQFGYAAQPPAMAPQPSMLQPSPAS